MSPFISVITICKDVETTIRRTIESVIRQNYEDFEYIVIDGGSADFTLSIINDYILQIDKIITGEDNGIYAAMNKGISCARGKYLIMMNGGDEFYENNSLAKLAEAALRTEADVVYGQCIVLNRDDSFHSIHQTNPGEGIYLGGMPTCHQSILYRRQLHEKFGSYDENYKILADIDFFMKVFNGKSKFYSIESYIAIFRRGGQSGNIVAAAKEDLNIKLKYFDFLNNDERRLLFDPWHYATDKGLNELYFIWAKYAGTSRIFAKAISLFYYSGIFRMFRTEFNRLFSSQSSFPLPLYPEKVACILAGSSFPQAYLAKDDGNIVSYFGFAGARSLWKLNTWHPSYCSCIDMQITEEAKDYLYSLINGYTDFGIKRFLLTQVQLSSLEYIDKNVPIDILENLICQYPHRFVAEASAHVVNTIAWASALGFNNIILYGDLNMSCATNNRKAIWDRLYNNTKDKGILIVNSTSSADIDNFHKCAFNRAIPDISILRLKEFYPCAYNSITGAFKCFAPDNTLPKYIFKIDLPLQVFGTSEKSCICLAQIDPNCNLHLKDVVIAIILSSDDYTDCTIYAKSGLGTPKYVFAQRIKLEAHEKRGFYFNIPNLSLMEPLRLYCVSRSGLPIRIHAFVIAENLESVCRNHEVTTLGLRCANRLMEKGDYLAAMSLYCKYMESKFENIAVNVELCARKMKFYGIGQNSLEDMSSVGRLGWY